MIWTNFFFHFDVSFLLRKVEDVTTMSKSQSLTSVNIRDYTWRVPNKHTTLFLVSAIIKAIFIQYSTVVGAMLDVFEDLSGKL